MASHLVLEQDGLIPMDMEDAISIPQDDTSGYESSGSGSEYEPEEPRSRQQESNAEMQIEDDFDRLINNIRINEDTSGNMLSKHWDFNTQDQDAQFRDDLRAASGIGKRRKKGERAVGPSLSFEVRSMIGDGNQAYVDGNLPEAIRVMLEVIRIEPRAASAWSVLAQCHEDMKQDQQALQLRIMAAHLRHDADEWERLARQSKELGYNQQALYCWGKQSRLDPANVNAQWDRASLARDMGDLKTTRSALLLILKRFPHDLAVLSELRTILVELSDFSTCTTLFQAAFEHYQKTFPSGHGRDPATNSDVAGGGFGPLDILVLADLYNTAGDYEQAVDVIRQGCRWLQGRSAQRYWDMCDDDREYDLVDYSRNLGDGPEPGMFPLDINARHRLSIARIKMGEIEEAKIHVSVMLSEEVLDYAPLFVEVADAYFEREMFAEARPIYEILGGDATTSSLHILLQTAICMRMMNDLKEAAEVYEYVRLVDPSHTEAKMKLAEIYEILNEPRKALDLVYEVIDARKRIRMAGGNKDQSGARSQTPLTASLFSEEKDKKKSSDSKAGRSEKLSMEALKELEVSLEQDTLKTHRRLTELWPKISQEEVTELEREWLLQAEKLVDSFRETRQMFTTSLHNFRGMFPAKNRPRAADIEASEDRMASRLVLELGDSSSMKKSLAESTELFRGLHFDEWLRLFFQYAFLVTSRGQFDTAEEVLKHLLLSVAFRSMRYQNAIRLAIITCAISAKRYQSLIDHCRRMVHINQFNNEPLRLLLAALSSGLRATDAFILSPLQKALWREMKIWHLTCKSQDLVRYVPHLKRFSLLNGKDDDEDEAGPANEVTDAPSKKSAPPALPESAKKANPVIFAVYGQMSIAAKSYQTAIFYLLQAFELCPEDPLLSLELAIASAGRAMQRQVDNRHHVVTQAMTFLSRYRQWRQEQPEALGEIDFNFGRMFQQLGLLSHAVTHYQKVLDLAEAQGPECISVAPEAAYNLAAIYVMTGAVPLAKALYRRWLSL
ncbi:TPR-like protein [Roridomyces roridus]|uniref:TPR-like protein n=1 Tax=Roridomyces roridus TaxID=1738132 RepID=A0AAD7BZ65_9AGAR|nr:TPR-like protein [Roridomyces roridus]